MFKLLVFVCTFLINFIRPDNFGLPSIQMQTLGLFPIELIDRFDRPIHYNNAFNPTFMTIYLQFSSPP